MSDTWHDRDAVFDGRTGWDEGDGVPVEVVDDDTTTITVLAEHDRRGSGEHPAWTQGIARAVRILEEQLGVTLEPTISTTGRRR